MNVKNYCMILTITLLLAGCGNKIIQGTEQVTAQSRNTSAFSSLSISGYYDVNITGSHTQTVTIKANNNLLPYIETEVSHSNLDIHTKKGYILQPQAVPVIEIGLPTLKQLDLYGDHRVTLKNMAGKTLIVNLAGSNQLTAQGNVQSLLINTNGNAIINGQNIAAKQVKIEAEGNAKILVNVSKELNVNISGAAAINYIGNPNVKQTIKGSGLVTKVAPIINKPL